MEISADYFEYQKDNSLLISLNMNSPKQDLLVPMDVIVVIDESYSMSSLVSIKENSSSEEDTGLCIIDIVKHATKTVINILENNDRLGLVGFSNDARVVLPLSNMTDSGKATALLKTDKITFRGNTNIWAGLKKAMEMLIKDNNTVRNKSILLLTDGVPNVFPKERDHIIALNNFLQKNKCEGRFTINTFGFGYQLDSKLLFDLALRGSGMYSFIPDASFVGTSFVNTVSNLKVTNMTNVNCKFVMKQNPRYEFISINCSNTIQNQQEKNIVFRVKDCNTNDCPDLEININNSTYCLKNLFNNSINTNNMISNFIRTNFVNVLDKIRLANRYDKTEFNSLVQNFTEETKTIMSLMTETEFVDNILKDIQGQVTEAISCLEWFNKWGKHYLPSLLMAHLRQQCNNFKDPGVQEYGGEIFEKIRDKADDIFLTIPPPTSSLNSLDNSYNNGNSSRSYYSSVNMSRFHSSSNPCFHGDSEIKMYLKENKKLKDLRKGDIVATKDAYATVQCIVKTKCRNKKEYLVDIDGLLITPYHPIIDKYGFWEFPLNVGLIDEYDCDYVYSIVLNAGHIVDINGTYCVTLGHNFINNSIVRHAFFGTIKVINELRTKKGWKKGLIELEPDCCIRNHTTGMVYGFKS